MKKWFNYFIYISILFLVVFLIRSDYFVIPTFHKPYYLIAALICLFSGFFADAWGWHRALKLYGFRQVKFSDCLISEGLSIFGKYIPGKIWVILGRSAYISRKYNLDEKVIASVSMNTQFISLWCALSSGMAGLFFIKAPFYLIVVSAVLLLFLSLVLFTPMFHRIFTTLFKKLFKRHFEIPQLKSKVVFNILPVYYLCWLTWCAGFWFLCLSMIPQAVPVFTGLSYALGASLGMMAIILPGGLGLREGLLSLFLIAAGLSPALSVTVSVSSRLWYLIGEAFVFILALVLPLFQKKNSS